MPAPSPEHQALGVALRSARMQAGQTERSLAARARVSQSHLGAIERGEADPSVEIPWKIADGLDIGAGELFARAGR